MSSRKRPLAEISNSNSNLTPSRHAPSTPHAIRALQQRSGARTRSARATRHAITDAVRPDSIRGVLRQFAKISAPVTRKRVVTPSSVIADKENRKLNNELENGDDNDSVILKRPNLTLAIEESIEEEDSELPVAPTPSMLPDEDEYEQPTITFQNVRKIPVAHSASERSDRRRSHVSLIHSEPLQGEDYGDQEADATILTERGRRALSEEMTGRLSRYSFGSIRMSDFGSELEIQRESDKHNKPLSRDFDDFVPFNGDESFDVSYTELERRSSRSHSATLDDSVRLSALGDETFRLELPENPNVIATANETRQSVSADPPISLADASSAHHHDHSSEVGEDATSVKTNSRRQTLLETATKSQTSQRKRLKMTRHGTTVPALPTSLIRRIVLESYEKQSRRKPKLGRDHIKALEQATEWFFEQVGEDLSAYSTHGRRKKRINMDDVLLMMKRQKVLSEDGEFRKLAKAWMPKDVFDGLDLSDNV